MWILLILISITGLAPFVVQAHEAYVLDNTFFWTTLHQPTSLQALDALKSPNDVRTMACIALGIFIVLTLNFIFRRYISRGRVATFFERFAHIGPHFVRFSIALAVFYSAYSGSFLGPELTTAGMLWGEVVRVILFASSGMFAFGILTEVAALLCVGVFVLGFYTYGAYMTTYLNYLGEFIVLLLFGMRVCSVDTFLFGPLRRFQLFEKYESVIVRLFYGAALFYAGLTVKLLHPALTLSVVQHWNLTQFYWLFPSDPILVVFGAGISEMVIGLFIFFGFEMRLTVLISLFYITLSLLFFRELVWPHLLLYGISLNLLVQKETFTLDHIFFEAHRKAHRWWLRPFHPHALKGKSSR